MRPSCPVVTIFLSTTNDRVVLKQVTDHQHPVCSLGNLDQLPPLDFPQHQRLFNEHVLACEQGLTGQVEMGLRRGRDHHPLDILALKHRTEGHACVDMGILFLDSF